MHVGGRAVRVGENPFSGSTKANLIRVREKGSDLYVLTRESSTKEFKENFTWGSIGLYIRTMAAFANARGGYIFFGVTDNPRKAVGLSAKAKSDFDNLDHAKLTEGLNDLFSPEIHWELGLIELGEVGQWGPSIPSSQTTNRLSLERATTGKTQSSLRATSCTATTRGQNALSFRS